MRISDWSSDVCSSDLVEKQQALHVVDADAPQAFVQQVGDQVQTADQLPEFTLETQVGRYAGHFIGQQQGPSGRIASAGQQPGRSEEHTSELQSLMRISYAVFCLKKKTKHSLTETT